MRNGGKISMKKLKYYIETWLDGKNVRGIYVSSMDIHECIDIYNGIVRKEKPCFINGNVHKIMESCGIKSVPYGIGWKVA